MTSTTFFNKDFILFFRELAINNNKIWFDENRKRYEKNVKQPFNEFIKGILKTQNIDLSTNDCIFRINRDLRFSKDKTPYKLHKSAIISDKGKKHHTGIYLELGPEFFKFYGGAYALDKKQLYKVRTKIKKKLTLFKTIISDKQFLVNFGEIHGDKNKVLPKEFKSLVEKQPLILNKNFYFFKRFPSEKILDATFFETILELIEISSPLNDFLNQIK